jgi:phosphatidylethanolamine-binding protein (PEBP) family uncharacterized protein
MIPNRNAILIAAGCYIVVLAGVILLACSPGSPGGSPAPVAALQEDTMRLPPEEAIASCAGKSPGDTCQFTGRDGPLQGVCDDRPGILTCAPGRDRDAGMNTREQAEHDVISTPATAGPVTRATEGQVAAGTAGRTFLLMSSVAPDGGMLPADYTCDGSGSTPALSWEGAPAGTTEFALLMTTLPGDGTTKWNWVLYGIPGTAAGLDRNSTGVGIVGSGNHGTVMTYDPPCSQGSGPKVYSFTLYALSASPALPVGPDRVTGPVLTEAIQGITLARATLNLTHSRPG